MAKRKCVFIGGAARSGTTMLGAILGSHSQMLATPESQFKVEVIPLFKDEPSDSKRILAFIREHYRFIIWNLNLDDRETDFSGPGELTSSIVDQYAGSQLKVSATYWVDHTPDNLRHADLLNEYFPDCFFIHLIRDGRAVMASQFSLDWGANDPVFAALKWTESLAPGLASETKFGDRCLRVQYEQLVLQPEAECKRICQFLGIEFEQDMILGGGFNVPAYSKLQHERVGSKPEVSRIYSWKESLDQKDIRIFESLTYDLLSLLGYEKEFPGYEPKPKEFSQMWILLKGAIKYLTINRWKQKRRIKDHS